MSSNLRFFDDVDMFDFEFDVARVPQLFEDRTLDFLSEFLLSDPAEKEALLFSGHFDSDFVLCSVLSALLVNSRRIVERLDRPSRVLFVCVGDEAKTAVLLVEFVHQADLTNQTAFGKHVE